MSKVGDEWRTPYEIILKARQVMGLFKLDPASSYAANLQVGAKKYHTIEDNGLEQHWSGTVWLNPPYSRGLCAKFVNKLVKSYKFGSVSEAILLVNAATDTKWFRTAAESANSLLLTYGRLSFIDPMTNKPVKGNNRGQALFYFGSNDDKFRKSFQDIGMLVEKKNNVFFSTSD